MRKTPEMNWPAKSENVRRNASLRLEDNDTDYEASEAGRFLQSGMARGAHLPYGSNDESIADIILNEINELYGVMREDAGKGYKLNEIYHDLIFTKRANSLNWNGNS